MLFIYCGEWFNCLCDATLCFPIAKKFQQPVCRQDDQGVRRRGHAGCWGEPWFHRNGRGLLRFSFLGGEGANAPLPATQAVNWASSTAAGVSPPLTGMTDRSHRVRPSPLLISFEDRGGPPLTHLGTGTPPKSSRRRLFPKKNFSASCRNLHMGRGRTPPPEPNKHPPSLDTPKFTGVDFGVVVYVRGVFAAVNWSPPVPSRF